MPDPSSSSTDGTGTESGSSRPTVRGVAGAAVAAVLPPRIRAGVVSVSITAPSELQPDQSMTFTIRMRNWLPIPIDLRTGRRPWYWHIDGVPDADAGEPDPLDELLDGDGELSFRPFETKRIERSWNGRLRRDPSSPFLPLEPGVHELGVEVLTKDGWRPAAQHEFRVIE